MYILVSYTYFKVTLALIKFLHMHLRGKTVEEFRKYYLSYDNMCHIDELRLLSKPLPLPEPYNKMWFEINKVIDPLHLANHSRRKCKELYDPEKAKKDFPEANFMSAEQTFAWQGRYKKFQFNDQNSLSLHDLSFDKGKNPLSIPVVVTREIKNRSFHLLKLLNLKSKP